LVPGGFGTRREVGNGALLQWLAGASERAEVVASVCTGSALLAKAGVLDGRRATTNKNAFDWVVSQGPKVQWQGRARWVEDGKFITSSGVSAGTDMALALIARLCGIAQARQVAHWAEYVWNEDSTDDPFARAEA
jgi:transcriptional regulator GlxA family with amidase domain